MTMKWSRNISIAWKGVNANEHSDEKEESANVGKVIEYPSPPGAPGKTMTRLAAELLRSEPSRKALQLLNQPVPWLEKGTPYERPEAPFFKDATDASPDSVTIFVSYDQRYGSFYGDSDHWDRSEVWSLSAVTFYRLLAKLEAGKEVSLELSATIIKTDIAWGIDCENPHETITHKEEPVSLQIGISPDLKTVTLNLLQKKADGFASYATLKHSESAETGVKK